MTFDELIDWLGEHNDTCTCNPARPCNEYANIKKEIIRREDLGSRGKMVERVSLLEEKLKKWKHHLSEMELHAVNLEIEKLNAFIKMEIYE